MSIGKDLLECGKEGLVNMFPKGGEEGSGQPILPWAFLPIYVPNRLLHLYHGERRE